MLDTLLNNPNALLAIALAFVVGALAMLGLLMALDAIEDRRAAQATRTASHTPPLAFPADPWGTPARSARADLRSGPR